MTLRSNIVSSTIPSRGMTSADLCLARSFKICEILC